MEKSGKKFRKRNAILFFLRQSSEHPSADMVYEALRKEDSDISRASVYRNLTLFKEQGLIASLGTVDGSVRFDGRVDPHVHFICKCCGSVSDVPDLVIPDMLKQDAQRQLQCLVESSQLIFTGTCEKCNLL